MQIPASIKLDREAQPFAGPGAMRPGVTSLLSDDEGDGDSLYSLRRRGFHHLKSNNRKRATDGDENEPQPDPGDNLSKNQLEFRHLPSPELVLLAYPPQLEDPYSPNTRAKKIYLDAKGGKGVTVYIVESGLRVDHHVFKHLTRGNNPWIQNPENWIYTGVMPDDSKDDSLTPAVGFSGSYEHGTAVAAKIIGKEIGIAPRAHPVIVKLLDGRGRYTEISQVDALLKIYDHIWERRSRGENIDKTILVQALFWNMSGKTDAWSEAFLNVVSEILKVFETEFPKAIFFTPAGDNEDHVRVQPARHILDNPGKFKNVEVVGGVSSQLGVHLFSEHPGIQLYSPATMVQIPYIWTMPGSDRESAVTMGESNMASAFAFAEGTEFATGIAAGVCALLMGRGWDDPLKRMKELAYKRRTEHVKVIWTGISRWPDAEDADQHMSDADYADDEGGGDDDDDDDDDEFGDNSRKRPLPDDGMGGDGKRLKYDGPPTAWRQ
ncbi:hypothetical protein TWF730_003680 [Orbilia blumenaviensis]|uniref:Peptidase S8/S53 domain-containing protein n=1 Tax=Orbilia blumenaviensis TaxID=1796055 RepID=A0AAV9U563_9PEZI